MSERGKGSTLNQKPKKQAGTKKTIGLTDVAYASLLVVACRSSWRNALRSSDADYAGLGNSKSQKLEAEKRRGDFELGYLRSFELSFHEVVRKVLKRRGRGERRVIGTVWVKAGMGKGVGKKLGREGEKRRAEKKRALEEGGNRKRELERGYLERVFVGERQLADWCGCGCGW